MKLPVTTAKATTRTAFIANGQTTSLAIVGLAAAQSPAHAALRVNFRGNTLTVSVPAKDLTNRYASDAILAQSRVSRV